MSFLSREKKLGMSALHRVLQGNAPVTCGRGITLPSLQFFKCLILLHSLVWRFTEGGLINAYGSKKKKSCRYRGRRAMAKAPTSPCCQGCENCVNSLLPPSKTRAKSPRFSAVKCSLPASSRKLSFPVSSELFRLINMRVA